MPFQLQRSSDLSRDILLQNALALTEPNLKLEQIQTHIIGGGGAGGIMRGKFSLADEDTDTHKVFGWK